ncbi:sulfotransferase family protein [Mycobacterium shigaense]|uniref:sulfotransferase family protein n=1 Tax=Mycobacterium shigaense TaxID=722731 RepID=UPI0032AFC8EA
MQVFVVGPPRSGMTIVTQFLNRHGDIEIFDEIDLIHVDRGLGVGTLGAFLLERGMYEAYQQRARETRDPAVALRATMTELAHPHRIWGEKNPRYATELATVRRTFPESIILFVLRDPRDIVNSCLLHRDSPMRADTDFWIADTVTEALTLVWRCLEPLTAWKPEVVAVRYEAFTARPAAVLDAALGAWGLNFSDFAIPLAHPAPPTAGDHQFFREGVALPWKIGNLSPLRPKSFPRERIDADDPAWLDVDALARRFGYH